MGTAAARRLKLKRQKERLSENDIISNFTEIRFNDL
jgi:hypothetical protein